MNQSTSENFNDEAGQSTDGNPYGHRYQATEAPNLDAGAPQLQSADMQRLNQRALLLLGCTVLLVVVLVVWMAHSLQHRTDKPNTSRAETLSVPDAPMSAPSLREASSNTKSAIAPIQLAPPRPRAIDVSALAPTTAKPPAPLPSAPPGPTLTQRRVMSSEGNASADQHGGAPSPAAETTSDDAINARHLTHPDNLMTRGTYIRCVLETRIVSDIPGYASCVVTEPVYSFSGHTLLLPKGSKVLGKYDMVPNGPRIAVVWDRIITPTGINVNMSSPGVDDLGGAGTPGYYNAHWGSRIGAALLISILSDAFKYEAAEHGPSQTTISNGVVTQTPFESNTAQTVQQLANQAVQRAANRAPTVTVNQGTLVNVYVARDVDFSGVVARL